MAIKQKKMTKKILFIVNVDWFFVSHRLPIALKCINEGFDVHIACAITTHEANLTKLGIVVHPIPIKRGSFSIIHSIKALISIVRLINSIKFDIVHLIAIQSLVLGGIATKVFSLAPVIFSISGLGYIFIGNGLGFAIKRVIIKGLLRYVLTNIKRHVIFQNIDDANLLSNIAGLKTTELTLIEGSGIDLSNFFYKSDVPNKLVFLMVSRLLKDKGIIEFCEAARAFKKLGYEADFLIAGDIDDGNPASITLEEMESLPSIYGVKLLGFRSDIDLVMSNASVIVLPSYREGFPKVLIEASAAGRAVITSDVPGCRDAVTRESAILVKPRNSESLKDAMIFLSNKNEKIQMMGIASRSLALKKYDISHIVDKHYKIYSDQLKLI